MSQKLPARTASPSTLERRGLPTSHRYSISSQKSMADLLATLTDLRALNAEFSSTSSSRAADALATLSGAASTT